MTTDPSKTLSIIVIGGGAAGFFGAIACAETNPNCQITLLEKNRQTLAKVRISGGGRCNVTHACFDPSSLVQYYPRGNKALRGPFSRFQPKDTIQWFEAHGVQLKIEADGRMFPTTDTSETIVSCLQRTAKTCGIDVRTEQHVTSFQRTEIGFTVYLANGSTLNCDRLLIATGNNPKVYSWLQAIGHIVEPLVPSLFTFNVPQSPLNELAGTSVAQVQIHIVGTSLKQKGPLLITHWGFSGPAILRLSAWGARILHATNYQAELQINWLPMISEDQLKQELQHAKQQCGNHLVYAHSLFKSLSKQLWKTLTAIAGINEELRWANLSKQALTNLLKTLQDYRCQIDGKSTYKEEFVTCGGIKLDEINFKTMESRLCQGLYFAGEILDIDGITGGFNFQNAWTTSWLAGRSMAE